MVRRGTKVPSAIFRNVLDSAKSDLLGVKKKTSVFGNPGIKGDERAAALAQFIRDRLPNRYGVSKGEAIDYRDHRTGQLDIIIYDADMAAPISAQAENVLVPAECLLAVIEVKTKLTAAEIATCMRAAEKVAQLRPYKSKFVPPRKGGQPADDKCYRCLYSIFAYKTDLIEKTWPLNELKRLSRQAEATGSKVNRIELVSVLGRGLFLPYEGAGKLESERENTFLETYIHMVNFLEREQARRPPIDWQAYTARSSKNWSKLKS